MTRVTNELRHTLQTAIMKDLPSRDYTKEIHALVQGVIAEHMPPKVRSLYDNTELRSYLRLDNIEVVKGNARVPLHSTDSAYVYGLTKFMTIRMDDAENAVRLPEGSLYRSVVIKLHEAGSVAAYFAQEELRVSVRNRVRANLAAARTFKQLYANLEPELHHYIPKDEVKAQVPACVAPVVDDLRKLGAVLPETPKATGEKP